MYKVRIVGAGMVHADLFYVTDVELERLLRVFCDGMDI